MDLKQHLLEYLETVKEEIEQCDQIIYPIQEDSPDFEEAPEGTVIKSFKLNLECWTYPK